MAKQNSLESLINDLDFVEKNFNEMFSKKYDNIMSQVILLIGQTTAYDTGVSRDIIKNILSELGRPELQAEMEYKVYNFWNTRETREKDNSTYIFNKYSDGHYYIGIQDYGITNQNDGVVSKNHPRQDKNVIPYNVEEALDKLETKKGNVEIIKAFTELEKYICSCIERGR